jgi:hypothetical protein
VQHVYFMMESNLEQLENVLNIFEDLEVRTEYYFSQGLRKFLGLEYSDKGMTLDLNKIRFYETTLDIKYPVEEMEVCATKLCHFFFCKRSARCSN